MGVSFNYIPPIVMSTHILTYQLYDYLALKQRSFAEYLAEKYSVEKKEEKRVFIRVRSAPNAVSEQDLDKDIMLGMNIQWAIRGLCEVYNTFAFLEAANGIYTAVVGIFGFFTMFLQGNSYDAEGNLKIIPIVYSVFTLTTGLQAMFRQADILVMPRDK